MKHCSMKLTMKLLFIQRVLYLFSKYWKPETTDYQNLKDVDWDDTIGGDLNYSLKPILNLQF